MDGSTPISEGEYAERLTRAVLGRAAKARQDIDEFFSFVMREEKSGQPLRCVAAQRVLFSFVMHHERVVIRMPVGASKCHGKGTPILMGDGSERPVEHVVEGDYVMGPHGPRRVFCTSTGRGQLFEVRPTKGQPFVVNEDHILTLVRTPQKPGSSAPCRQGGAVVDISVRDYLRKSKWFRENHKLFRVPVRRVQGERPLPIDPYFLGVWFGDGNHSTSTVKITNIDPEVRSACLDVAREHGLCVVPYGEQTLGLSQPGGKRWRRSQRNPLLVKLRELVGDGLSMDVVRRAPWADRLEFLAGFIDADGTLAHNTFAFSQKRRDWAETVAFVARSLGIGATIRPYPVPGYGMHWAVCLYGKALEQVPTRIPRKRIVNRLQKKDALRTGFTLQPLGVGDYYGFTIGGDGRYLLGDCTVTHNTFCMAALTLFLLGNEPTERGAIISASQEQSMKPLSMVQDYIEQDADSYPELRLVFPELRPSHRSKDPWQQNKLVVERRPGIRDASLTAIGFGGKLPGSRLSWILVDDLLTEENTSTAQARAKVNRWFGSSVLSRKDIEKSKFVVMNTPWNPGSGRGSDTGDLTYKLERAGWPTLTMDIEGDITISHADPEWDCDDIRPSRNQPKPSLEDDERTREYELAKRTPPPPTVEVYRLTAHDSAAYGAPQVLRDPITKKLREATPEEVAFRPDLPHHDLYETIPLWPERFSPAVIEDLREVHREQFPQLFKCITRDDASAEAKTEWFERAKRMGYAAGFTEIVHTSRSSNPIVTGIDLGVGTEDDHDWSALFTVELIPEISFQWLGELRSFRNMRRLLKVEYYRLEGRPLVNKIRSTAYAYNGILKVETNAAQKWIQDWTLDVDASIPILSHTTGAANKHHRRFGVAGLFLEIENGAWLIPSDSHGRVDPAVQRWIDEALNYKPTVHAGDGLIASWIARTLLQQYDATGAGSQQAAANIALAVGQR